jgi:eukaryotic-like serine/threonine-protein kinase
MANPHQREVAVFESALQVPREQREAYLHETCGDDLGLRDRIRALLRAHENETNLIEPALRPPGTGLSDESLFTEKPGYKIGPYKLLQQIGAGGCGIVYMAEQDEPIHRRVALKLIKLGMDTKSVVARFDAERRALALMDHPNIAKVLDAGATENGRPFFVMELVRGVKITEYCDENNSSTRERLELFIQVCRAVQHAHQKGVIHRDLKPSNILVTLNDGIAIPKVIDFGIAKAIQGRLTDQTVFTAFEQFIGTPAYMSPEQALMTSLDVDTRSDIYSLGVLLYELLTGKTPFDTQELLKIGLAEMRRTICETEPARPSTRLSTLGQGELTKTARRRKTEPPQLIHAVRDDLDWIVMKCLEKERVRRYETANGLARDMQRHLNNEPVVARPPGNLYRINKFVLRNKLAVGAAAALAVVLLTATLVSAWQAVRARQAQAAEATQRRAAEAAQRRAQLAEAAGREELRDAYLAQAQAGRWSGRMGRRFEGLAALGKAAAIRPGLDLRNEAIACMTLADLRRVKVLPGADWNGLVIFDPQYLHYAATDAEGNVRLCRVEDSREIMRFSGYTPPFIDITFSNDGKLIEVTSGQHADRIELLDLERKQVLLRLPGPNFRTIAFSADNRLAAISYNWPEKNWPVQVFDLAACKEIASFEHGSLPYFIRFNPQKPNLLLTSDQSPNVRVWDWQTARVVQTLAHPNWVTGIDWHPQGEMIATGCADNKVRLWNADTGKERAVLAGHEWVAFDVTFSADGQFLASRGWEGMLRLWDVAGERELLHKPTGGMMSRFSLGGNRLADILTEREIEILEASPPAAYRVLRTPPQESPLSCDFSPDGRLLVSAHLNSMRVWNLDSGQEMAKISEPYWWRYTAFHPNGTNVYLLTDGAIEEWALQRGLGTNLTLALSRTFKVSGRSGGISLSQDGSRLAVRTDDALHMFDVATGLAKQIVPSSTNNFSALSPDGSLAATWTGRSPITGGGTNVEFWDVATSRLIKTVPGHAAIFVSFSPDKSLAVVGDDVEFRAWDLKTWETRYVVPRVVAGSAYMAFSHDSRVLAAEVSPTNVRLIEAATGRELATLEPPELHDISGLAFNAQDTQLAVVSSIIALWDLRTIRQQLSAMNLDWNAGSRANPLASSH